MVKSGSGMQHHIPKGQVPLPPLTADICKLLRHLLACSCLSCLHLASVWLVFKSLQKEALSEWDFQVSQRPVLPNYSVETGGLGGGDWLQGTEQGILQDQIWVRAGDDPELGDGAEQKDAPELVGCLGLMCGASDHVPVCYLVDPAGSWTHSVPAPSSSPAVTTPIIVSVPEGDGGATVPPLSPLLPHCLNTSRCRNLRPAQFPVPTHATLGTWPSETQPLGARLILMSIWCAGDCTMLGGPGDVRGQACVDLCFWGVFLASVSLPETPVAETGTTMTHCQEIARNADLPEHLLCPAGHPLAVTHDGISHKPEVPQSKSFSTTQWRSLGHGRGAQATSYQATMRAVSHEPRWVFPGHAKALRPWWVSPGRERTPGRVRGSLAMAGSRAAERTPGRVRVLWPWRGPGPQSGPQRPPVPLPCPSRAGPRPAPRPRPTARTGRRRRIGPGSKGVAKGAWAGRGGAGGRGRCQSRDHERGVRTRWWGRTQQGGRAGSEGGGRGWHRSGAGVALGAAPGRSPAVAPRCPWRRPGAWEEGSEGGGTAGRWAALRPTGRLSCSPRAYSQQGAPSPRRRRAVIGGRGAEAGLARSGPGRGFRCPFPRASRRPAPAPVPPRGRSAPFARPGNAVRARGASRTSLQGSADAAGLPRLPPALRPSPAAGPTVPGSGSAVATAGGSGPAASWKVEFLLFLT
ncbi:hypothetical protein DV515_00016336 [Chloebia gouldiae]|uniref:Uncharacterized protein n=1 Tax=Chloebia gouldiae TaxID=44316 RepID=A0A3L8RSR7_CHLGU|nr:hypothetical protein DV515_00016336 [Chloebia gouldiae]